MILAPSAESLAGRLRLAIHARNTTASAIAQVCGFSKQNMQRFLNGEVSRSGHFQTMARTLEVPLTWLMVGDPTGAPEWAVAAVRQMDIFTARDGNGPKPTGGTSGWRPEWQLIVMHGDGGAPYAHDGDLLILDPTSEPIYNDVLLMDDGGRQVLKRCGGLLEHGMLVASIDQGRDPSILPMGTMARMRVVVGTLFGRSGNQGGQGGAGQPWRGRVRKVAGAKRSD